MEETKKGRVPDYKGKTEMVLTNGMKVELNASVWVNQDKNNNNYLTADLGGVRVNMFKFEPKPKILFS